MYITECILSGVVQSKGTNLEIFEHEYTIMHIVRGGPVERY